ncbi:DUF4173 domain-containing protein [Brevundimonas sp.]|uniref:DUF4153 domain-containing protein n=1 Tax=Brevundimonas sp. TaxID=1871086 RepID=UPI002D66359F|nr:DUF4173 domain-containing protein [Brevundimonas sp.]HYD27803.1 DUF4173 domain-containing protein [Brevundimonas sp.]
MLRNHPFTRGGFWLKSGIALLLAALADALFFVHQPGATLGAFALAWVVGVAFARPGLRHDRRAVFALAAAVLLALVLIDRPGMLAWGLFGLMLSVAVLSARVRAGDPVWRWIQRLVVHAVVSAVGPVIDLVRLTRPRRRSRRGGLSLWRLAKMLVLPLVGGAIFLALFASANPLISNALDQVRAPSLSGETILRAWFWGLVVLTVGASLRPRWRRRLIALPSLGDARMPGVTGASIILSLVVFNALFALQNGLDIAFLWSGAPLPDDMSLADYAHRGAYPLIATALLAGLFVLVALRPGSETAKQPLVRALVVLWVGQNMLLVASSLLRTADYIEAYALTRFRIAAMIWMVLVAAGLLLILWRMLRGKDGHWLIDANVRLTLVVLALVSTVDLGAVAAAWNVRHAREIDGTGATLDLGYLRFLGAPALVSLVELEQTTSDPELRDRAAAVRAELHAQVRRQQSHWRGWTWRDARRLDRIEGLTGGHPLARPRPGLREYDGGLIPPAPLPPVLSAPSPGEPASTPPPAYAAGPLTWTPGA